MKMMIYLLLFIKVNKRWRWQWVDDDNGDAVDDDDVYDDEDDDLFAWLVEATVCVKQMRYGLVYCFVYETV